MSALATIITVMIAAPVLRAPSERVFGMEIVGRHHDPFTVMAQFERPIRIGVYSQPVTDISGALLARLSGGVAAYNWVVLLSFPLSAAAAFLLARHLALSPLAATVAAIAYAFSPFHLAHAAYHPHIAQTQWMPLYFLALWRCLDSATPRAVGVLGAATIGVTLSNFYGGLIAAVITPVAVAAYWVATRHAGTQSTRRLGVTLGSLAIIAASGIAYAWRAAGGAITDRAAFAFPRADLFRYSAKWWGYLVPPVAHPLLGDAAHRLWIAVGIREGLLEQQVSLGAGIVALGLVAVVRWLVRDRQPESLARVPILIAVATAALLCSLSPERTIGTFTFVRPSAFLYQVVPMFRSYARFGLVVQLMAVLLAGIGIDWLRRAGTARARTACVVLVALAAAEYTVSPSALWRDVLPTTAHRWVVRQTERMRVLDCTRLDAESESVQWLTQNRVTMLGGSLDDCTEPNLPLKLAASGYTHLLIRHRPDGEPGVEDPAPDGLRLAARFADGQVFAVTSKAPAIYTLTMTGFSPREHNPEWTWRWMGNDAAWTIVNTRTQAIVARTRIELSAFHGTRHLEIHLDGHPVQTLVVDAPRRIYEIGPLAVSPGEHALVFHPAEAPTVANEVIHNGDGRSLSFAIGRWSWE